MLTKLSTLTMSGCYPYCLLYVADKHGEGGMRRGVDNKYKHGILLKMDDCPI